MHHRLVEIPHSKLDGIDRRSNVRFNRHAKACGQGRGEFVAVDEHRACGACEFDRNFGRPCSAWSTDRDEFMAIAWHRSNLGLGPQNTIGDGVRLQNDQRFKKFVMGCITRDNAINAALSQQRVGFRLISITHPENGTSLLMKFLNEPSRQRWPAPTDDENRIFFAACDRRIDDELTNTRATMVGEVPMEFFNPELG